MVSDARVAAEVDLADGPEGRHYKTGVLKGRVSWRQRRGRQACPGRKKRARKALPTSGVSVQVETGKAASRRTPKVRSENYCCGGWSELAGGGGVVCEGFLVLGRYVTATGACRVKSRRVSEGIFTCWP